MSKKKKKYSDEQLPSVDEKELYKLKTDAVDRLVNASKATAPNVTEEEISKYRGKGKLNIPNIVKVIFIKWWFAGAICFFFYFGLGGVLGDTLDLLFVFGTALGICTDLLTKNILHFFEPYDHANDKYMLVTSRKFWSIFLNVPYEFVLLAVVMSMYGLIDTVIAIIAQTINLDHAVNFGVEPILFGLLYLAADSIFVAVKNTFIKIVDDAKKNSRR